MKVRFAATLLVPSMGKAVLVIFTQTREHLAAAVGAMISMVVAIFLYHIVDEDQVFFFIKRVWVLDLCGHGNYLLRM